MRVPPDKELDTWSQRKLLAGRAAALVRRADAIKARRDADYDVDKADDVIQAMARALARLPRRPLL